MPVLLFLQSLSRLFMSKRSIIITGAARGVGAACAKRFAREGDYLTLVDKDEEAGKTVAEEIKNDFEHVVFVHANISSRLHVHNIVAEALESYDKIDILVNADTHHFSAPFLETSEEEFTNVIQRNLIGSFLINQAVAKQLIRQMEDSESSQLELVKHQGIVNLCTVEEYSTQDNHVALEASMGGLQQLTKAIARSLSPHRIRANAVGIGAMRGETKPEENKIITDQVSEPVDAANLIWFILSEQAEFITGQMIYVDGRQLFQKNQPTIADRET